MIERRVIDQIIARAEIADVVGDFVTLHRKGRDFIGLCPFHDDTNPSFSVSTSKNICKCFSCGEGGTPLSFIMKHENLSFPEAIKYLGRKYGIEVIEKEMTPEEMARKDEREKLINGNRFACDVFIDSLHQGAEGRRVGLSYFRERGLTDETIKEFELGYSPSDWDFLVKEARKKGIEMETLEQLGLIMKNRNGEYIDRYRERIIFPIHSTIGNIVGFGGRILKKDDKLAKYINSPASELYDKSNELYGLYFAKREISKLDKCIVLEGYIDVLSMAQRGIKNVVASSGTALTRQQVQHIRRFTPNVTLLFDSDGAGIKAALKGLDVCLERGMNVQVLLLPEGEDPDSYAQTHTLEDIQEYFSQNEEDGVRFKAHMLAKEYGDGPQARAQITAELAETIAYIDDDIVRQLYEAEVSKMMEVTQEAIKERVDQIRSERRQEQQRVRAREMQRQQQAKVTEVPTEQPFTNLSTLAPNKPREQFTSKIKEPKIQNPLSPCEETLLHDLMDYGAMVFKHSTTSTNFPVANGVELIYHELFDLRDSSDLTLHFEQLLEELMTEIETNPELNVRDYIAWHEKTAILHSANKHLTSGVTLSPIHKSFEEEQSHEKEVTKLLMKDVLTLKLSVVERKVAEILMEINQKTKEGEEDLADLMLQLVELNGLKSTISQMLGDRIITPKSKIDKRGQ